jgi:hypothetical protein
MPLYPQSFLTCKLLSRKLGVWLLSGVLAGILPAPLAADDIKTAAEMVDARLAEGKGETDLLVNPEQGAADFAQDRRGELRLVPSAAAAQ